MDKEKMIKNLQIKLNQLIEEKTCKPEYFEGTLKNLIIITKEYYPLNTLKELIESINSKKLEWDYMLKKFKHESHLSRQASFDLTYDAIDKANKFLKNETDEIPDVSDELLKTKNYSNEFINAEKKITTLFEGVPNLLFLGILKKTLKEIKFSKFQFDLYKMLFILLKTILFLLSVYFSWQLGIILEKIELHKYLVAIIASVISIYSIDKIMSTIIDKVFWNFNTRMLNYTNTYISEYQTTSNLANELLDELNKILKTATNKL